MTAQLPHAVAYINGGDPIPADLLIEVGQVDVSTLSETTRDLSWECTDAAGHYHAYDSDGKTPTLKRHEVHVPCDGNCPSCASYDDDLHYDVDDEPCEGWTGTELRCELCGEVVVPAWITNATPGRRMAPGRTRYEVTVLRFIPTNDRVSVRFVAGTVTYFGFGQAFAASGPPSPSTTFQCGPMARRAMSR